MLVINRKKHQTSSSCGDDLLLRVFPIIHNHWLENKVDAVLPQRDNDCESYEQTMRTGRVMASSFPCLHGPLRDVWNSPSHSPIRSYGSINSGQPLAIRWIMASDRDWQLMGYECYSLWFDNIFVLTNIMRWLVDFSHLWNISDKYIIV